MARQPEKHRAKLQVLAIFLLSAQHVANSQVTSSAFNKIDQNADPLIGKYNDNNFRDLQRNIRSTTDGFVPYLARGGDVGDTGQSTGGAVNAGQNDDPSPKFSPSFIETLRTSKESMNTGILEESNSCAAHVGCQECYSSSSCHWCGGSDGSCHVKGSIHGCMKGAYCESPGNKDDADADSGKESGDKNGDASCSSHDNCSDCYSSHLCHWCGGPDGACHAEGSVHGCLRGDSCSASNDNSTDGGGGSNDSNDNGGDSGSGDHKDDSGGKEPKKDSCASHDSCGACYSSHLCHWCGGSGGACHAKGSIHGCLKGDSCIDDDSHKKNENACTLHTNCTECALSSHLCHWCASDNKCHTVGSVHGCFTGVDCLANDQCQRQQPENVKAFKGIGFIPLIVILSVGAFIILCSTGCYAVASAMLGLFNDMFTRVSDVSTGEGMSLGEIGGAGGRDESASLLSNLEGGQDEEERENQTASHSCSENNLLICKQEIDDKDTADDVGISLSLEKDIEPQGEDYILLEELEENNKVQSLSERAYFALSSEKQSSQIERSRHAIFLSNACKACFLITIIMTTFLVSFSVMFFPKLPEYNICNQEVGWSKTIESMKSMELDISIELLISLYNPNYFDVDLDKASGALKHNDKFVGKWTFPDGTSIKANSITDFPLKCAIIPDKWEALALAEEFYKGTLVLDAQIDAHIRMPSLLNYTFKANMDDYAVTVNRNDPKLGDRHLCACPQWKDLDPPKK